MDNSTATKQSCDVLNYEITTFLMMILFLISEILPFLKKTKAMGIIHSALYILKKSKLLSKSVEGQIDKIETQFKPV